MEVIKYNPSIQLEPLSVTIGAFDGIHEGHKKLFRNLYFEGLKTAVITFSTHPDYLLGKREDEGYLDSFDEKLKMFASFKIDYVVLLDKDILSKTYNEFNALLRSIGVKRVVVGKEFRYGKGGCGNIQTLETDFIVDAIDLVIDGNSKMSSQIMRKLLSQGKVDELIKRGYEPFSVSGVVNHGKKMGSKLGFPTANISFNEKFTGLLKGVYKVNVEIDGKTYIGVCNIGVNPSIDNLEKPRLEVNILDYDDDLYGKNIKVTFLRFIRPEMKFKNIDELKETVNNDIKKVKQEG